MRIAPVADAHYRTVTTSNLEKPSVARNVLWLLTAVCCLVFPVLAGAQTLAVGSVSGDPGTSVELPVSFAPGASGVATLQFDLAFPSSLTPVSTSAGSAALVADKSASGSTSSGSVRILIFGLNQNTLGSGQIALVRFTIAGNAPAGSSAVTIGSIVASNAAGGNVAASGVNGSVVVNASTPSPAPVISSVAASAATASSAVITWMTDRPADSQVEFGTTTGYGSSTTLDGSPVTSHVQMLTGLQAGTVYHYRVKSRDGGGNLALSNDFSFATSDQNPLEISGVAVINITGTSATIVWTTNNPSDSQVEYGTTLSLGSGTALSPALVTSHSQTLTGLTSSTVYHFRVKSRATGGEVLSSSVRQFTTVEFQPTGTTLYYPRTMAVQPMLPGDQEYTGLAIANLDSAPATLRFTSYNSSGGLVTGDGITNPVTRQLLPGQQLPIGDHVLFGGLPSVWDANGWVKIESNVTKVAGFFLMFNGYNSELDGATMYSEPILSFVFPEIRWDGFSKVNIGNPNADAASLSLSLIAADGSVKASSTREIPANGALVTNSLLDLFPGANPGTNDYIKVTSDRSVFPHELTGRRNPMGPAYDTQSLQGQNAGTGATRLYSPQYVTGGMWRSSLSVINLDSVSGSVTFRYMKDDGVQIGSDRVLPIAANGKIFVEDSTFFEPDLPAEGRSGYVEISGGNLRLTGSVVFGDIGRQALTTALPLTSSLERNLVFSQVSSNDTYYTGVAIVNPNVADAHITASFYNEDGSLGLTTPLTIPAQQRICKLLTEIFPTLAGQQLSSGYFKITSDLGVASFAVFGTRSLSVLSAIPPQIVR